MQATSFLLGVLVIVGAYEVSHATYPSSSSSDSSQQILDTLNMANCDYLEIRLACHKRKFRTFDGTCNNLCNTTLGAINTPLLRFPGLDPPTEYDTSADGQDTFLPRGEVSRALANTRKISRIVFDDEPRNAIDFTHITMTWGQFIDHDITLTELAPGVECGSNSEPCSTAPGCIGIEIQAGKQLAADNTAQCIPLSRSFQNSDGNQINLITAYIDGSQVYGSDLETATSLRDPFANLGFLDVEPFINSNGQPILPEAEEEAFCLSENSNTCFRAGDVRVNENQALMTMHALWVREHNRIALALHVLNPTWKDEKLFQVARKIVGAQIQHITYNEWLEVLFNDTLRENGGVKLEEAGEFFNEYDPNQDPGMINSFSTAAMRMGHTLIRNEFSVQTPNRTLLTPILTKTFFNPDRLFDSGLNPYGGILQGLVTDRAERVDRNFVPAVLDFLIIESVLNGVVIPVFGDLPAINLQRGRDHGIPGYVNFLNLCTGLNVASIDELETLGIMRSLDARKLDIAYGGVVENIDLFAGGILENIQDGSELGPTFTCMLLQQFRNLRFGDRFWYERNDTCTGFTLEQLTEIRKSNMARVICDNADDVRRIQGKVFRRSGNSIGNPREDCDQMPFVDLNVFKDESEHDHQSHTYGPSAAAAEVNTDAIVSVTSV